LTLPEGERLPLVGGLGPSLPIKFRGLQFPIPFPQMGSFCADSPVFRAAPPPPESFRKNTQEMSKACRHQDPPLSGLCVSEFRAARNFTTLPDSAEKKCDPGLVRPPFTRPISIVEPLPLRLFSALPKTLFSSSFCRAFKGPFVFVCCAVPPSESRYLVLSLLEF